MLPKAEDCISIDLETYDPNLEQLGPGTFRGDGLVAGIAIKVPGKKSEYIPVGHTQGFNWDKEKAIRYVKELTFNNAPKLGANLLYDLEWLDWFGIHNMPGLKIDVQVLEPLIDENKFKYNLESLGQKYLGTGKLNQELIDYCHRVGYVIKKDKDLYKYLYRMPSEIVAPYATMDTELPLSIYAKQRKIIIDEGIEKVALLESRLTDPLLQMRIGGVPVDVNRAEQVRDELIKHEAKLTKQLTKIAGRTIAIHSAEDISIAFTKAGIKFPYTTPSARHPNGQPSFTAPWLEAHPSELAKTLVSLRKVTKMRSDFIEGAILKSAIKGLIHSNFRQVKHDEGGTVSGRFASDNPNLQQVPSRDPVYAPLVRSCFVAEAGAQWFKGDWSQQEPRLTVHYAFIKGFKGADIAAQKYIDNPDTDYHQMVADMCGGIKRRDAKDINLGLAYGMGIAKMAEKLGKTVAETKVLFQQYHAGVPFIKLLSEDCMRLASTRGYIKTILGRRRRFESWVSQEFVKGQRALDYDDAIREYGLPLRRAFTHKALNSLIQGSAADMVKKALLDTYNAGHKIYLTVHDEICGPVYDTKQIQERIDIMVNAVKLKVPIKLDAFVKSNWGDCHD